MTRQSILISGGGIAGLTLAYWLDPDKFDVTVVEKRSDLSDRGYMIDFYASGYDVAEKMGILPTLAECEKQYALKELALVDAHGKTRSALDIMRFKALLNNRHLNLMRGDLEETIFDKVKDRIRLCFGTSIMALRDRPDGVEVDLSDGSTQTFDLVIGAGGIHSRVRELVWGDESQFDRFLGFYVACAVIDNFKDDRHLFSSRIVPKKQISLYAVGDTKLATFLAWKSEHLDHLTRDQKNKVLDDVFGDMDWIIPQVLDGMREQADLFFDGATQIRMETWSKGRVALVGDACQCLTLLAGQGASMAMAGAYTLAGELNDSGGDYTRAYQNYQAQLKPEIDQRQEQARKLAGSFVPNNQMEVFMTNLMARAAFLPGIRTLFRNSIGAESIIH